MDVYEWLTKVLGADSPLVKYLLVPAAALYFCGVAARSAWNAVHEFRDQKHALELEKLRLEIAKLRRELELPAAGSDAAGRPGFAGPPLILDPDTTQAPPPSLRPAAPVPAAASQVPPPPPELPPPMPAPRHATAPLLLYLQRGLAVVSALLVGAFGLLSFGAIAAGDYGPFWELIAMALVFAFGARQFWTAGRG